MTDLHDPSTSCCLSLHMAWVLNGSACACDSIDSSPSDGRTVVYMHALQRRLMRPPSVLRDVGLLEVRAPAMDGADDELVISRPLALWMTPSLVFPKVLSEGCRLARTAHCDRFALSSPDGSFEFELFTEPREVWLDLIKIDSGEQLVDLEYAGKVMWRNAVGAVRACWVCGDKKGSIASWPALKVKR